MSTTRTASRTLSHVLVVTLRGLALSLPLILPVFMTGTAFAQALDIPAILDLDRKMPPTGAIVQYGHQFKVDVENDGTKISKNNASLALAHRAKLSEDTALLVVGTYALQAYDFSGGRSTTPPVNYYQWDDVHRLVLIGLVGHDLNDEWRLIGGGVFRSWGEGGADYGDSITGGLLGGFDYHPDEDFSIGLLIGAVSALESSVGILPVPTLKWTFAENWRLNVGVISAQADPGIGAEVTWQVRDNFAVGAGATYLNRRYRLKDKTRVPNGSNPSRPNRNDGGGIGQETELPIFALVRWKPTLKTAIDLQGGVAVAGNVRVEDSDGGRIKDDNYDPAPFVALKGTIFF